jgi:hypothetical protein
MAKTYKDVWPATQVKEINDEQAEELQTFIWEEVSQDPDTGERGDSYVEMYNNGNDHFRRGFNAALVWILGWTLPTLINEKVSEGEDDE